MTEAMLTEKYRPKTLEAVLGQAGVTNLLKSWVRAHKEKNYNIPHCLFIGRPGTGKTTCATALANELFEDGVKLGFHELNASDERGIDTIRGKVKDIAKSKPMGTPFTIIFLDEADSLTKDAQAAMRRIMEQYHRSTRFILSVNYANKIIEPIVSRCAVFRFSDVSDEVLEEMLKSICGKEGMTLDDESIKLMVSFADGKPRDLVNIIDQFKPLQHIMASDIRGALKNVPSLFYIRLYKAIRAGKMQAVDKNILKMYGSGWSTAEFFDGIFSQVIRDGELSFENKVVVLREMGTRDYYVQCGGNEKLQLRSFVWQLYHMLR